MGQIKFLIIGDIHFRVRSPRSRTDNIKDVFMEKFIQLHKMVLEHDITYALCTGDVFDDAEASPETILFAHSMLKLLGIPVFTIVGNHDMVGNSNNNFQKTSLSVLELLGTIRVLRMPMQFDGRDIHIIPKNYGDDRTMIDRKPGLNILMMHSMIAANDKIPGSIPVDDVKTNADLIICGHNHKIIRYGKVYNPGALIRLTSEREDRQRAVEVAILDVSTDLINAGMYSLTRYKLDIMPENKCFNIDVIEEKEKMLNDTLEVFSTMRDTINKVVSVKEIIGNLVKELENEVKEIIINYIEEAEKNDRKTN